MRSYIVLVLTLLIILLFDAWGQGQLTKISDTGSNLSGQIYQDIQKGEWTQADQHLEKLSLYYKEKSNVLSLLVEHNHLDAIELSLEQAKSLLLQRQQSLALITLDELVLNFTSLSTDVSVSWTNII
jgi:hypothetical protein